MESVTQIETQEISPVNNIKHLSLWIQGSAALNARFRVQFGGYLVSS